MRSTASGDFLNHQVTSATGSELYFRFYFYVTSYPSSNGTSIFAVADLNLDGVWLLMNTNGVLELWNADNDVLIFHSLLFLVSIIKMCRVRTFHKLREEKSQMPDNLVYITVPGFENAVN